MGTAMIELDANVLVAAVREEEQATKLIRRWVEKEEIIAMSSIAWSEFMCGPLTPDEEANATTIVTHVEPFDANDAVLAAELFNATERRSRSHADCMIAAHAIRRNAVFATLNVQDFRPFKRLGLKLV